jgi:hypothetical protein
VPIPLFVGPLLLLLLFPDGRLLSRRWRLVARGVVLLVSLLIASSLRPGRFDNFPTLVNPLGVGGAVGRLFDSLDPVMSVLASVLFLAAAGCLVLRLREEIDLDMLARELRQAVVETMEPRHVSLWLRKP